MTKNNNDNSKSANSIRTHWLFKLDDAAFICLNEIEHTKCKGLKIKTHMHTHALQLKYAHFKCAATTMTSDEVAVKNTNTKNNNDNNDADEALQT